MKRLAFAVCLLPLMGFTLGCADRTEPEVEPAPAVEAPVLDDSAEDAADDMGDAAEEAGDEMEDAVE